MHAVARYYILLNYTICELSSAVAVTDTLLDDAFGYAVVVADIIYGWYEMLYSSSILFY